MKRAINALNQADVFFVMDKGLAKEKLAALRRQIVERFISGDRYRTVEEAGIDPGLKKGICVRRVRVDLAALRDHT
ncbi:hypothetical protein [Paraburkholderia sp. RAU2J]|uniref:hypothetical protein n=1 Tax=Paraburkholderia sp. RAU2J TaxID=1938810 RepID=UPI001F53F76B|nr:hypothetical protein [Paraburkholderia sp. RAU2J]